MNIQIKTHPNGAIHLQTYINNLGEVHRLDGPAVIKYYESGKIFSEEYIVNDKFYREDGPAIIYYYESGIIREEHHCLNDKWNNENAPATVFYLESGEIESSIYYFDGIKLNSLEEIQSYKKCQLLL